jgi:murein DD-endopeptidase
MKTINVLLFFFITCIPGIGPAFSQAYQPSLDMRIPYVPAVVIIDGKPTVYYELHLTNFAKDSIDLVSLKVLDSTDATLFVSIGKEDLQKRFSRIGISGKANELSIPPGGSGIIYIEFTLQKDKLNVRIAHLIEVKTPGSSGSVQGAVTYLSKKPLVLGPPLSAGPWAAIYEPSWERGHRRVIYTANGKARIPGRFAIDFIRLDNQGRYATGDNNTIKNWYGYGNDVLAVADGIIASTRDDFSESPTLSAHPAYAADKATGNFISIDIGNNHFAFYEHLQPGSIKVKPGQPVKKGAIIAAVGFTGQTTGPHLHFHIADANSPLGAEGIPFVFKHFTLLGSYVNLENFGMAPWLPLKNEHPTTVTGERPAPNTVIKF